MPRKTPLVVVAVLAVGSLAALSQPAGASTEPPATSCDDVAAGFGDASSVGEALAGNDELSILTSAVESAGLADAVATDDPFTVLAPTDSAFDEIPPNVLESILADRDLLESLIAYHVLPGGAYQPEDLAAAGTATSAGGADLTFSTDTDDVVINDGAAMICGGAEFGAGTILVIDHVLVPPAAGGATGGASSAPPSSTPTFTVEQEAVAEAFETAVDSSLSFDEQAPFIEDADDLRTTIESYPDAADAVLGITAEVTSVTIEGDAATITYVLSFNGVETGYGELDGTMARIDGTWVVPRDEYCAFQAQARNACPEG